MIDAAERHGTKLMTAYRLHFEAANLQAIESVVGGKLGETRQIHAVFSMVVRDDDNVRLLPHEQGGGPVYDLGVYCINAARYLFRAEPDAVTAIAHRAGRGGKPAVSGDDVDTVAVMLSFPGERVMTFTTSFAAAPVAEVRVVGSKGDLRIENAFEYVSPIRHWVTVKGRTRKTTFRKRDQFAPELLYFADCVLQDRRPEPSGIEGLADVRVIEAIYRSIAAGKTIQLSPFTKERRPDMSQEIRRPPVKKPREIHAQSPSEE